MNNKYAILPRATDCLIKVENIGNVYGYTHRVTVYPTRFPGGMIAQGAYMSEHEAYKKAIDWAICYGADVEMVEYFERKLAQVA